ncbi:MAG: hypothetical protein ACLS9T_09070 [Streptococcus salivarius]
MPLHLSQKRQELKDRWQQALRYTEEMEVVNQVEVDKQFLPLVYLNDWMKAFLISQPLLAATYFIIDVARYLIVGKPFDRKPTDILTCATSTGCLLGKIFYLQEPL